MPYQHNRQSGHRPGLCQELGGLTDEGTNLLVDLWMLVLPPIAPLLLSFIFSIFTQEQ
jgi:hypothetical protein